MKIKYLLMAAMVLPCAMFMSCGDDDDDETKPNVEDHENKIISQKVDISVDNSFKPQASYIQAIWAGDYKGWDAVQEANTTIRRRLTLNPNGTYKNEIAGKLKKSGDKYFPFESEGGTYTYNASTGIITYTCEYDSLIIYSDQSYKRYTKKHYYSKDEKSYTEEAKFSESKDGQRVWITKDMYLQSLTAEQLDLVFSMSKFDGDKENDQNKN